MTRVAVIDCGTNTIRLLVADVAGGNLVEVFRDATIVRLGEGVDRTGEFAPQALARTLTATGRYAQVIADTAAERVRFVATSATRDVRNRAALAAGVHDLLGVELEVISGDAEAEFSFAGATHLAAGTPPFLVVDLGGGSTELVLGTTHPEQEFSMQVGSVRLTERYLLSDPPTDPEVAAARDAVRGELERAQIPAERTRTIIGLAGSITTITAYCLGLATYDRDRVNGAVLPIEEITARCQAVLEMPRVERAKLKFLQPGRVDVIGAGALIWSEVVAWVRAATRSSACPVTVATTSEHDLLDGIALATAGSA